jgi:hypothetical protein
MGNLCNSDSAVDLSPANRALVFIKPLAQTEQVRALVRSKLLASKIAIVSEGEIAAKDIDEKKLIDQHYYAIASKATLLTPDKLPVPDAKFKEKFGEEWATVLKEGRAINAMQACEFFSLDVPTLDAEWRKCEAVKFGGGFYCAKMTVKDKTRYVFNAFFMQMRNKFTAPGKSIYYFTVSWDPADCSWSDFRGMVLGPTDPAKAPAGAIRGDILAKWKELGLDAEPNNSDNGVHASASPFEGLAERMNWLEVPVGTDPFGAKVLAKGLKKDRIAAWSKDPRIMLEDGSEGSIFDALEDMDEQACLEKLQALNSKNS